MFIYILLRLVDIFLGGTNEPENHATSLSIPKKLAHSSLKN